MPKADVVSGQRQPGSVGFRNPFRYLSLHQRKIARPAQDTLLRIDAVTEAQVFGGIPGQHHDAPHAGGGHRFWIPVGFLITDGRQQTPVFADGIRSCRKLGIPVIGIDIVAGSPGQSVKDAEKDLDLVLSLKPDSFFLCDYSSLGDTLSEK